MYRERVFVANVALIMVAVVLLAPAATAWQAEVPPWSVPVTLAGNVDYETWQPKLVTDSEGKLHVAWLAWTGEDQPSRFTANTVYYTHWDGATWSRPADIVAASGTTSLGSLDLVSTPDGRLLLTWENQGYGFLAQSSVRAATDARSWVTTSLGPGYGPRVAYDSGTRSLYVTLSDTSRQKLEFSLSVDEGQL
jgi:hypothetical protein